jgi:peptide deformylase
VLAFDCCTILSNNHSRKILIYAFGSGIYQGQAQLIGEVAQANELIKKLIEVQKVTKHPIVTAKHVGLNLSLFVVDLKFLNQADENFQGVFINTKLISTFAPLVSGLEDDLSIPRLTVSIDRPKQIEVSFLDEKLPEQTATFSDLAARWILHGIDQVNGISIIDKLNKHRQRSLKGHLKRLAEHKIETKYKLEYD